MNYGAHLVAVVRRASEAQRVGVRLDRGRSVAALEREPGAAAQRVHEIALDQERCRLSVPLELVDRQPAQLGQHALEPGELLPHGLDPDALQLVELARLALAE